MRTNSHSCVLVGEAAPTRLNTRNTRGWRLVLRNQPRNTMPPKTLKNTMVPAAPPNDGDDDDRGSIDDFMLITQRDKKKRPCNYFTEKKTTVYNKHVAGRRASLSATGLWIIGEVTVGPSGSDDGGRNFGRRGIVERRI